MCLSLAMSFLAALAAAQDASSSVSQVPAASKPTSETGGASAEAAAPGFSLLASVGYGTDTETVYRVRLEPYGTNVGAEAGYTFRNGVHLGAFFQYGLGRGVAQRYDPVLGNDYDLMAESTSLSAGAVLAYDLPFYMFVLRYALHVGFTRMTWDFAQARRTAPAGFDALDGSQYGFELGPALSLLWETRVLQSGLAFEYLIQTHDRIPSGVIGKWLVGVKL